MSKRGSGPLDSFFRPPKQQRKLSSKQPIKLEPIKLEPIQLDSDDDDCVIVEEPPVAGPSTVKPKRAASPQSKNPPTTPTVTSNRTSSFFSSPSKPTPSTSTHKDTPLNTSIYHFHPSSAIDTSSWPNHRVPYSFLVTAFSLIASTKSRLEISTILSNMLRVVIEQDPASLHEVVQLCSNRMGEVADGLEMGIGSSVLTKTLTSVSGLSTGAISKLYKKHGDPGDVAQEATQSIRLLASPPPLIVHSLYAVLLSLCHLSGPGSQGTKTEKVKKLLVAAIAAKNEEPRFLVRTLIGNLRTGAVRLTLTKALARAFCLALPEGMKEGGEYFVSARERKLVLEEKGVKSGKGKAKAKVGMRESEMEARMSAGEALMKRVWARHPNFKDLIQALLSGNLDELDARVPLSIGTPLQPMLGQITRSLDEIYTRLGSRPFVSEAKLDGQRGQIHVSLEDPGGATGKGRWHEPKLGEEGTRIWVRIFSRNLEDTTSAYPDILHSLSIICARDPSLKSFILDAEICAIHPTTLALRSFQELSYRPKKDVALSAIEIRAAVYIFDLMYLNGTSLLSSPFRERRNLLRDQFKEFVPEDIRFATIQCIPSEEDNDSQAVSAFFHASLKLKSEGIMVKLLDDAEESILDDEDLKSDEDTNRPSPIPLTNSPPRKKKLLSTYQPDIRAGAWLKVKADYLAGMGDSLDLVPVGAWHGNGRKKDFWSPILLAVWDEEGGEFQPVCKVMSGFSDEFYKDLNARYGEGTSTTSEKPFEGVAGGGLNPSVWFLPSEVWEIKGADFTLSPVYLAAQSFMGERGISIRFPRFLKRRLDKGIEQATTARELSVMFREQGQNKGVTKGSREVEGPGEEEEEGPGEQEEEEE